LGWGQGIEIRGNFEINVLVGCALQCRAFASEEKNQSEQTMIHVLNKKVRKMFYLSGKFKLITSSKFSHEVFYKAIFWKI
jgi:hydroxyethylthiazole kinase-like sugar kinase family protein